MIRKILFAILLTHSALIAQSKPSRIILQAPHPPNANTQSQVPVQTGIPPPQRPAPPLTGTTSAPVTTNPPPGVTSVPVTPVPVMPVPVTPVPVTPVPVTPVPVTPVPVTPIPVTPVPVTPVPVTPVPVTPVPVTPVPVTPVPTTKAPTTAAPTTGTPTTAAPTTPAPTTATPTLAPLPPGYEYGAWGQVCPIPTNEQDCQVLNQMMQSEAVNNRGIINCDRTADCCKCGSIQCGVAPTTTTTTTRMIEPHGCEIFSAGDYGVYGVKQIVVIGNPASGTMGAQIDCVGRSACQDINLFGDSITRMSCNAGNSCSDANFQIDNPVDGFWIDCNGRESCSNTKIIVNIGTPIPEGSMCNPDYSNIRRFGGIKCNAPNSCNGLQLTINNRGCDRIIFDMFDLDQVNGANFNFNGAIDIDNCVCGPNCNFATGLGKCFQNLERLICPDIRSCMNMVKTIINPMDMFYLECSNELSCAMADLTIDLEQDQTAPGFVYQQPVRFIQSLKFGGTNSGRGAIIHIHNHQLMDPQIPGIPVQVTIGLLECAGIGSCQGLTIYTGDNVNIMHRICNSFEACVGCMIKKDEFDIGIPCNPNPRPILPSPWLPPQQPQFIPV